MNFSAIDIAVFIGYCLMIIGLGLFVSRTKKGEEKTSSDYFLAGRTLPWWAIGASLIASNISAEQFIGMSGSGFAIGLGIASYEWLGAVALLVVGKFFLPVFLRKKIFTMPQFLEMRFDNRVRYSLAIFWLLVYVFINLTSVLYLGALVLRTMLDVPLQWAIVGLAVFSAAYSVYGGLKAVALKKDIAFKLAYMANTDREIHLRLLRPDGTLVGENIYEALGGFGHKEYLMVLDSLPSPGKNYSIVADIRTRGGAETDTFLTCTQVFEMIPSIDLEVEVLDIRDDSPIENATVGFAGTELRSDENGEVIFSAIDPGPIHLIIIKEGFKPLEIRFENVRSDSSIEVHLTPESFTLIFFLTNNYTGDAIQDAFVNIGDASSTSNYNGEADHLLFAGEYSADIIHPRYADTTVLFTVDGNGQMYMALRQILADAKFILKQDGSSLYKAKVNIDDRSATTSTIGIANFPDLRTDRAYTYTIWLNEQLLEESELRLKTDSTIRKDYTTDNATLDLFDGPRIYPNPADQQLILSGYTYPLSYKIIDIQGKIIASGTLVSDEPLDIHRVPEGLYLFRSGEGRIRTFRIARR